MIFHSAYDPANSAAQRHQRSARELPDVRLRLEKRRRRRRGIFRHLDGINGIVEKNEIKLIVGDPNVNS